MKIKNIFFKVKFVYSAELSINFENAIALLKCSETFKMKKLQDDICDFLKFKLSKYNLKELFVLFALTHELQKFDLKIECIKFIKLQKNLIVHTAEWRSLLKNKPELLAEIVEDC